MEVDALRDGRIKKPVVAWVSGTCAKLFKSEVQFGHAGAKSGGQAESAQARSLACSACSLGHQELLWSLVLCRVPCRHASELLVEATAILSISCAFCTTVPFSMWWMWLHLWVMASCCNACVVDSVGQECGIGGGGRDCARVL